MRFELSPPPPRRSRGFTLVELLIVVIILAIIAAIVVPQLSASTSEARESALDSTLSRLRSAVDLYRAQHGHWPGNADASGGTCPAGATIGSGDTTSDANRAIAFAEQLTMYTNAAGQACSKADTRFKYGPYIQAAALGPAGLPDDPVNEINTLAVVSVGDLKMDAAGTTTGGWKYDALTGKFIVNHQDYDDR